MPTHRLGTAEDDDCVVLGLASAMLHYPAHTRGLPSSSSSTSPSSAAAAASAPPPRCRRRRLTSSTRVASRRTNWLAPFSMGRVGVLSRDKAAARRTATDSPIVGLEAAPRMLTSADPYLIGIADQIVRAPMSAVVQLVRRVWRRGRHSRNLNAWGLAATMATRARDLAALLKFWQKTVQLGDDDGTRRASQCCEAGV